MTEYVYLHQDVFRNKIDYHKYICNKSLVVIFYTDKTKTDSSFSDTQFLIDGYQFPPLRNDRNQNGGRKIVFIKVVKTTNNNNNKRLTAFQGKTSKSTCLEITLSEKL